MRNLIWKPTFWADSPKEARRVVDLLIKLALANWNKKPKITLDGMIIETEADWQEFEKYYDYESEPFIQIEVHTEYDFQDIQTIYEQFIKK